MSTRKIFAGIVALVAVFAVVATAGAQTSSFNTNLTIGSTGADVVALQTFLEAKGHLVMPSGVAKGYFGSLTKSALAKYQAAKGITPAVGYFGPITRAAVNADMMTGPVTTNPCPTGYMPMGTSPVVCVPGSSTSTPVTTSGIEGTLDVRLAPSPANNSNVQSSTDVAVYGLEFRGRINDVVVDRVDLQVAVVNNSQTENPSTLINTIKAWDGSSVLKTWSVGSADFIKDPSNSSVYYVRLSGLNFLVPKDTTKTLTFSFSTNGGIDTDRSVTIDGYGSNSIRAVSGNNITSYYSADGLSRSHTFKKPGSSTLTLSADANTPDSTNFRINRTGDGYMGATLQTFNVKSETGDSKVTDIAVTVTASSSAGLTNAAPTTLTLVDSSGNVLDSRSLTAASGSQVVTFTNLSSVVSKDQTRTYTIKADFPSTTATGTQASTTVTSVTYERPNGNSATVTGSVSGNNQYFYPEVVQLTFVSGSASVSNNTNTGSSTNATVTFTFKAKAVGASATALTTSDIVLSTSTTGVQVAGIGESVTVVPNDSTYADGAEYTVTYTAAVPASSFAAGTNLATFYINSISWDTANQAAVTQTYGLDDFKTNAVTIVK